MKEGLPPLNLGLLQQRHRSLSHQLSSSLATPHITPSTPTYAQLPWRNKAAWKKTLEEEEKELDKGPPQFIVVLDFSHRKLAFVFSDRTQAGTFELGLALVAKAVSVRLGGSNSVPCLLVFFQCVVLSLFSPLVRSSFTGVVSLAGGPSVFGSVDDGRAPCRQGLLSPGPRAFWCQDSASSSYAPRLPLSTNRLL